MSDRRELPFRPRRRADGVRGSPVPRLARAGAAHRRRIAVHRRGGGDRRCRRLADLPRLVVPAAGRRLLARRRRDRRAGMEPPLGRLAGGRACGDRLLRARHPARRPVAPRQSSRIPARARRSSVSARCSRGRTSSRSICPSARTATFWCPRSSCSWWAPARACSLSWRATARVRAPYRWRSRWSRSGCSSAARLSSAPLDPRPASCLSAPVETALGIAACLRACCGWRGAAVTSGCGRCSVPRHPAAFASRGGRRGPTSVAPRSERGMVAVAVIAPRWSCLTPRGARIATCCARASDPSSLSSSAVSPLAAVPVAVRRRAGRRRAVHGVLRGALPERVRLATLDSYDGEIYRSGGAGALDQARFVRVPSTLDAGTGRPVEARITIEELDGIWMPTVGQLESVDFSGDRAARSPIGSTTARLRRPACRPRAAA